MGYQYIRKYLFGGPGAPLLQDLHQADGLFREIQLTTQDRSGPDRCDLLLPICAKFQPVGKQTRITHPGRKRKQGSKVNQPF